MGLEFPKMSEQDQFYFELWRGRVEASQADPLTAGEAMSGILWLEDKYNFPPELRLQYLYTQRKWVRRE